MRFVHSYILWTLFLVPLFFVLSVFLYRKNINRFYSYGDKKVLLASFFKQSILSDKYRGHLAIAILFLLLLAYSGPQYGYKDQFVTKKTGDVVFCVDLSNSMLVKDVKPSRLKKASHMISSFLTHMTGERAALVVFAGDAFIQCPLTIDYDALNSFSDQLSPALIPKPGTSISNAINKAIEVFDFSQAGKKVIIVLTDGEDHDRQIDKSIKAAIDNGVVVYTIGVGTSNGEPIPNIGENGNVLDYLKDNNGNIVVSKLNTDLLQRIASSTGGAFYHATPQEQEVKKILLEINGEGSKTSKVKTVDSFVHRFQYPLFLALFFMILYITGGLMKKDEI